MASADSFLKIVKTRSLCCLSAATAVTEEEIVLRTSLEDHSVRYQFRARDYRDSFSKEHRLQICERNESVERSHKTCDKRFIGRNIASSNSKGR